MGRNEIRNKNYKFTTNVRSIWRYSFELEGNFFLSFFSFKVIYDENEYRKDSK